MPSNLWVNTNPEIADFVNNSAWLIAFCPVVASNTNNVSCGASAISRLITL